MPRVRNVHHNAPKVWEIQEYHVYIRRVSMPRDFSHELSLGSDPFQDSEHQAVQHNNCNLKKIIYKVSCAVTGALLGGLSGGIAGADVGRWVLKGGFDLTFLIMPDAPTVEAPARWGVIGALAGAILGFRAGWESASIICNYSAHSA